MMCNVDSLPLCPNRSDRVDWAQCSIRTNIRQIDEWQGHADEPVPSCIVCAGQAKVQRDKKSLYARTINNCENARTTEIGNTIIKYWLVTDSAYAARCTSTTIEEIILQWSLHTAHSGNKLNMWHISAMLCCVACRKSCQFTGYTLAFSIRIYCRCCRPGQSAPANSLFRFLDSLWMQKEKWSLHSLIWSRWLCAEWCVHVSRALHRWDAARSIHYRKEMRMDATKFAVFRRRFIQFFFVHLN